MKYYLHHLRHNPVSGLWEIAKFAIGVAVFGSVVVTALGIGSQPGLLADSATSGATETGGPVATASSTDSGVTQEGYNLIKVEAYFIQYLNQERSSRGLQNVSRRDTLTQMGRNHSQNMATHDYFGHEEPDGDTIKDRYQQNGLLPECRLPISGSDRYYPGAENVAGAWVNRDFEAWKTGEIVYIDSERELARYLFNTWMRSKPHREAMLVSSADEAGLGIYIDDRGKVYASLELC